MNQCPQYTHLVVLPHLRVQNANAVSSALTHGFPSMTAFLGLMWALERKAVAAGLEHLAFNAVGVVRHDWQEMVTDGYVKALRLTRNPKALRLTRNPADKDGSTAAIVEEGRIHLELSLVFAVHTDEWEPEQQTADLRTLAHLVADMRIAGGTVVPAALDTGNSYRSWIADMRGDRWEGEFRRLRCRLLPGSTLVERTELIGQRLEQLRAISPQATRLDAWLSLARNDWHYVPDADDGKGRWVSSRSLQGGWIVPIAVGYGALSELYPAGSVRNARDQTTPFRFVESLYSIGEWIGTHRLRHPDELLWWADSQPDSGLYRCRNGYPPDGHPTPPAV